MINALDNPILIADLDAQEFDILNCSNLMGADNVLYSSDSRMSNARSPLDGIIDDAMVAEDAGIVQSKLLLNGSLPPGWLGSTDTTAAQGDLVQYISEKDQINGYSSLGAGGRMPSGSVPISGTGTVTEIDFSFPGEFSVVPDISTTDKSFTVYLSAASPESWFGNSSGSSAQPSFITDPFPIGLIPDLGASQFTNGTFSTGRLPTAVGVGVGHQSGMIPVINGDEGLAGDYLARDMTFKKMETPMSYQPTLPNPAITILYYAGPVAMVDITENVKGTNLFYSTSTDIAAFTQIIKLPIQIAIGATVMVYASKVGYNNSEIVKYTIPDPTAGA